MPKEKKERYIVSAPLYTSPHAKKVLEKRFNVAHHIYNCFLGECKKRQEKYKKSKHFKNGVILLQQKKLLKDKKEITAVDAQIKKEFSEAKKYSGWYVQSSSQNGMSNSLEQFAGKTIGKTWLGEHIDSHTRNKLMERAFKAVDEATKSTKKIKNKKTGKFEFPKIRFKRFGVDYLTSVEGKNFDSPLRYEDHNVVWSDLILPIIIKFDKITNEYKDLRLKSILKNEKCIKYIRLKRKMVKNEWQYYVDFVCEGKPDLKKNVILGTGIVGVDVGPSTIAYAADEAVVLRSITSLDKRIYGTSLSPKAYNDLVIKNNKLARKISRQRKKNNENKYNDDNTIKKGNKDKWKVSNRQRKTQRELANLQRKIAETRRCEHGKLLNDIRSLGDVMKVDDDSYKGWQKSGYGRSVGKHAPGQLIMLAKQKFELTGGEVKCINTFKSKSSQRCPNCDNVEKKGNGEDSRKIRLHECFKCGFIMQRDITSAIVNKFIEDEEDTINADESMKFIEDKKPILQACINGIKESARVGYLPSTFGTMSELERIACDGDESVK